MAIERGASGCVGRRGVDGNNQVWEFEISRGKSSSTVSRRWRGGTAGARAGLQLDHMALTQGAALGCMDIKTTVVTSVTGNEVGTTVEFEQTIGADREAGGGSRSHIALELSSGCWSNGQPRELSVCVYSIRITHGSKCSHDHCHQ